MASNASPPRPRPRPISTAGYLAYLYGIFGILTGLAAAFTFVPYRYESTYNAGFAELFTVLAALGVVASLFGAIAGWGLFRDRAWAWNLAVGVAAACIGLNAVMAGFWPGYVAFLAVIAAAYGLEVLLLVLGRNEYRYSVFQGAPAALAPSRKLPAAGGHP